ncbi:MAG: hypothetical protein WBB28_05815 [Crinalium sp.]
MWNDDFESFLTTRTQNLLELVSQAMGKIPANALSKIDPAQQPNLESA